MANNLHHCETGFGVYRSTQLGHFPLFLLLYLLVGPSNYTYKVHSRWIFSAKLLSRFKPAPPFLVIFTLSCFIRDRAIERRKEKRLILKLR
jgi:hypothetical protein